LANEAAAAGAECLAQSDFPGARGAANQEEIRNVDASDQQDEHDRAEEHEDGEACVSSESFAKRFEVGAETVIRLRVLLGEARGNRIHL
jgi:hypothetical protein